MKKIKLITGLSALAALGVSAIPLTSCNKKKDIKEVTGIIVEVERKTYRVGDTVTKDNITVYQSLDGTQGDQIPWTSDIKVYDGETLLSDFITNGIKLTTYGVTKVLTIKYGEFSEIARIPVSQKQYKISCSIDSDECATLSDSSFYADEGTVWGTINKPSPVGKKDVWSSSLDWTWVDPETGDKIDNETVIENDMSAKMMVSLKDTKSTETVDFTKSTDAFSGGTSYVPAVCMPSTSLKYTTLSTDIEYTFNITVPSDTSIKWFWIYNGSQTRQGELMYIYEKSIISIQDESETDIDYTIVDYDRGGTYIEFTNAVAANKTIKLTFRMLRDFTNCIIPAFQHQAE